MAENDTNRPRTLGDAMRELRERADLSQAEVARRMGLNASAQTQLGRYEHGKRIPRADTLRRFLEAVDASFSELEAFLEGSQGSPRKKVSKRTLKLTRELLELGQNGSMKRAR